MPETKRRGANVCRSAFRGLLLVVGMSLGGGASAQVPPSPAEVSAYDGLHLSAYRGDLAALRQAIAAGRGLEARDGEGRTALLAAAHARQREAMRELAKAGADPRALDSRAYDAITIAAVADDIESMRTALAIGGDPRAITSPYLGTALIAAAHLGMRASCAN